MDLHWQAIPHGEVLLQVTRVLAVLVKGRRETYHVFIARGGGFELEVIHDADCASARERVRKMVVQ